MSEQVKWEDYGHAAHVEATKRDEWAERMVNDIKRGWPEWVKALAGDGDGFEHATARSGDSYLIAVVNADGRVELFDCQIRRRATVTVSDAMLTERERRVAR